MEAHSDELSGLNQLITLHALGNERLLAILGINDPEDLD